MAPRYPTLPGPYTSRYNLPAVFLGLPFALLRSQLYPKFPGVVEQAVAAFPETPPVAFLPDKGGYNSHSIPGIQAVLEARSRLQALHDAAIGATTAGAGIRLATAFPVPYPNSTAGGPVEGYDTTEIPFAPRHAPPSGVDRLRQIYAECPWVLSPSSAGPRRGVTVTSPMDLLDSLTARRAGLLAPAPEEDGLSGLGYTAPSRMKFSDEQRGRFQRVSRMRAGGKSSWYVGK